VTYSLPPGRVRRGQLLLTGKLDPRDAHPTELAYATRHILTHPNLEADAFRRSPVDVALAELRASLGDQPRRMFGEATLRAVQARLPETACRRCRAHLLARVYKLQPPGFDAATVYLIGAGCDRCRPRSQPQPTKFRPSGAALTSGPHGPAPPARTTVERLKAWIGRELVNDPVLTRTALRMLGDQPIDGGLTYPPSIGDQPVHSEFR
jgi:hypothetical protein